MTLIKLGAAVMLAAAGLVLAASSPVAAVGPTSPTSSAGRTDLDALKRALTTRIDARITSLDTLSTAVDAARHLTPDHRSTLSALVAADLSGLTSLDSAQTAIGTCRTDLRKALADAKAVRKMLKS